MQNTWPRGKRHAMHQRDHEAWNSSNFPGTLQICCKCGEPTTFCEEDGIFDDDGNPYCRDCGIGAGLFDGDNAN